MATARARRRIDGGRDGERAEEGDDGLEAGGRFRERAIAGEYEGLRAAGLARTVGTAGEPPGLREEIGMVRIALARLLEEETDAAAFAAGVARLVSVAVQAARVELGAGGRGGEAGLAVDGVMRRLIEEGERE